MRNCVTHHNACDCREEKFKHLDKENIELHQTVAEQWTEIQKLKKENKILLEAVELIDCTSLNSWKGDCKCPNCKFLNKVKEIKGE